ncbi:MAG: efflux transporter outer membrane subunit [Rhodanobacter sp.]|jgi:NodT family efflux transporter outer membrane factor (OMF) lipoprotein|nr:efflux transporter outer membrane subunit [Rhodanobacter sp.]
MPVRIAFDIPHTPVGGGRIRAGMCALCITVLLALAGCATMPPPPLGNDTPAVWQNAPADMNAPAPDLRGWWKAFNDPALDRLVDAALAANLTVAQAGYRVAAARRLADHRNDEFLPQLGAHTFAEPVPDSSASYFQAGFDAKWEFGLFGRVQARSNLVYGELGMTEADAQAARVSVVAEVARAYMELRGAQQRLALLQQLAAGADEKVNLMQTRLRLRLGSANDLARAQVEQAAAQAALVDPQLAMVSSQWKLAVLLGKTEPDASLVEAGELPDLGELRVASVPADLLRTRPEIRRAEAEVLKAAGALGLARAELYPRIGFGGSLTYSARVIGHTRLADADGIVTLGPVIDIPLFDWGMRRATADARDAELSAALLAYRQAVIEGIAEAEDAMATLEHQRDRIAVLDRGLAGVEQGEATFDTLHALGLADGLDGVSATAALAQARIEVAQAEQARNLAFIALYKALGGAPLPSQQAAD